MTIFEAVTEGDTRKSLAALRDRLARDIDKEKDPKVTVQLAKELRAVIGELDNLPQGKGVSAVDEVAKKRAERRKAAAAQGRT